MLRVGATSPFCAKSTDFGFDLTGFQLRKRDLKKPKKNIRFKKALNMLLCTKSPCPWLALPLCPSPPSPFPYPSKETFDDAYGRNRKIKDINRDKQNSLTTARHFSSSSKNKIVEAVKLIRSSFAVQAFLLFIFKKISISVSGPPI